MTLASYLLGIGAALLVLVSVFEMLRRGQLRERHTLWWLTAGIIGLVVGIFPDILNSAAQVIGVEAPINLVFFLSIVVLFLVCLQQSSELTRAENRSRTLAEQVALLDNRLERVEDELSSRTRP
ncbi:MULTISPECIES: DUF2304 domain-containing protein [unclassified Leucobacter]|uniref:DUF2304 domain-containing protein n=1 Tax=unclassified Leucobacter TaxID=2621730 RepID=UPI00165DFD54|nr:MULTISPECIES: DUF2304 domain-containing protein [unclassified Leucobacter]MBC9936617.1 DUF2304 domain-containing protein [Leucobacter sp. cx-87]